MPPTEASTLDERIQADSGGKQLGMLLVCFDGHMAAAKARPPLETQLQSRGDDILDSVIFQVGAKHHASVYDPRRVARRAACGTDLSARGRGCNLQGDKWRESFFCGPSWLAG
jgi:hypothetical protein